ncbi:neural cell adhesion molecule 1 isoform X2 [Megalops cyprinoides]|uniref:neural cell adhesion molecule 1 isoform X2 n=1 Tax=Megalops cyprinoides TaxID=118141 RepID=UPI0018655C75|nr:neural cell adhesion molecule 1 isoform X2 [Megalops cyprinoides]
MTGVKMQLAVGAVLLLLASLTDAKMEIITNSQDLEVGNDQLLLCKAGAEGDITWRKDGEDIEEDGDHLVVEKVDETSSKLTIKKATLQDTGRYTCACEFESGHNDETSVQIYVYEGPTFGNMSTYHEFLVGQDAVIPCVATGLPSVDVKWSPGPSDGHLLLQDNSLVIRSIRSDQHGTYVCEATIRGRPISKHIAVSVVINVPPTVAIHEKEKSVLAGPSSNVTIICLVSGFPHPTISWNSPPSSDASRYVFNSDKSELVIPSVVRSDFGEYTCTGTNKISESSATFMLDVSEHPKVALSVDVLDVDPGQNASVTCEGSGHPPPKIQWVKKSTNQEVTSSSSRVKAEGPTLEFMDIAPSDGGLYTCVGINTAGNSSTDFSLQTWPGTPDRVSVSPGPTSAHFSLYAPLVDGGSPIIQYTLQWRKEGEDSWSHRVIQSNDPLVITSLKPYTSYSVRFAAKNRLGQGGFSLEHSVRTQAKREPDSPVLKTSESQVEKNSFSIPISQLDNGGSPITHYIIRYRPDQDGKDWQEMQLLSNATALQLSNLQHSTSYQLQVMAVNANGTSRPAQLNFTMPVVQPQKTGMGKGGVVGIVMLIFLVLLIAVDATCCYTNRCGLLMFLAVKLLGQKAPVSKGLEEGDGDLSTIDVKLNGLAAQRGSIPKQQQQNGAQSEVTCDKAPLTKFEKLPANSDPSTEA